MGLQFKNSVRELLLVTITGKYTAPQMKEMYRIVFSIATPIIRKKIYSGKLVPSYFKLSPDDLTHDCIAEIFQLDEENTCIQIKKYFNGLTIEELTDDELFAHFRRLVFGKINNNIFRIFSENDPALGKILRNIKLALLSMQNYQFIERFGEICIAPTLCETNEHLPQIDRDELESQLRLTFDGNEKIPALLGNLSRFLREQEQFSRVLPVMNIAQVFRSLYFEETVLPITKPEAETDLTIDDTRSIIKESCNETKIKMAVKYIDKKNISTDVFDKYFKVIEQTLIDRIIHQDGDSVSYFERLQAHMPELTKQVYSENYKSHIEHLTRITYEYTINRLRKEL